ncbi:MAG: hypothetical protein U9N53_00315, partial [Bacteroidota bacterium]|nr:hypothetical protein [Bacteroidota bacterium]
FQDKTLITPTPHHLITPSPHHLPDYPPASDIGISSTIAFRIASSQKSSFTNITPSPHHPITFFA